jgi:hypothetical protein
MSLRWSIANLLLLLGCVWCAAETVRTHRRDASSAPVPVSVELRLIPESLLSVERSKFTAEHALQLQKSELCFQTKLDLKQGIPVAALAPQKSKRYVRMMDALRTSGKTHVWDDMYLDYLPDNSYHLIGYMNWFLLQKNPDGSIRAVVSDETARGRKDSLVSMAKPGDVLLGGWSF